MLPLLFSASTEARTGTRTSRGAQLFLLFVLPIAAWAPIVGRMTENTRLHTDSFYDNPRVQRISAIIAANQARRTDWEAEMALLEAAEGGA